MISSTYSFDSSNQVHEYKDEVKKQAEQLVLKGFPETIVSLNSILETAQFNIQKFSEVHQDLNISVPEPIVLNGHTDLPPTENTKLDNRISQDGKKVMILPTGAVSLNKNLVELIEQVKPHIRKLVEDSSLMKMWITFVIPKIEDGNNSGVSIQEDILAEVQSVESETAALYDQISRYFISRGKLISKVTKYPHIDDCRRAVQELDEKVYLSLWLVMSEIRNRYCALHNIVLKNLDKIKNPRSSNATKYLY